MLGGLYKYNNDTWNFEKVKSKFETMFGEKLRTNKNFSKKNYLLNSNRYKK